MPGPKPKGGRPSEKKPAVRLPGGVRQLARRAVSCLAAEDWEGAAERAWEAARRAPDWPEPYHAVIEAAVCGKFALKAHFKKQFRAALEALVRLDAAFPDERLRLGLLYVEAKDPVRASPLLAAALKERKWLQGLGWSTDLLDELADYVRTHAAHVRAHAKAAVRKAEAPNAPADGASPPIAKAPPSTPAAPPASPPVVCVAGPATPRGLPEARLHSVALPDAAEVARRLATPVGALSRLRLAREAHVIALAERYDELLCLRAVHGVEEHGYQVETVRRVLRVFRGRALLADEVGLGKTIEAGLVLKEFVLRGMVRSALILVPPALVSQWRDELTFKFDLAPLTTEDAIFQKDAAAGWAADGVLVASLALARSARHRELVATRERDLIIVDEAHHAKSHGTETWKLLDALRSRFLLMLTATPVENDLEELYNLVTLLKPGQLGTRAAFKKAYVARNDPCVPRNPEALRQLLADVMIRNTRAVVGVSLPPRHASTLCLEPTPLEARVHARLTDLLRERFQDVRERLFLGLLLQEACSSLAALRSTLEARGGGLDEALRGELAALSDELPPTGVTTKEERLVRFLKESKEPALVFSRFRATASRLEQVLEREGVTWAAFHGGMTAAAKDAAVEAVRAGRAQALLATQVGGEGRNLHFLRTLVNVDLPWNPMEIEQRIGRVHRLGQQREVLIVNLALKGTVEDRILEVLDQKINLFELVVGELDLILGQVDDGRDFEQRVLAILGQSRTDDDVRQGFDRLADELAAGRRHFDKVKALDAGLFADEYGA